MDTSEPSHHQSANGVNDLGPQSRLRSLELEFLSQCLESSRKKKSRWEHPVSITILSFLLTGVIGLGLTSSFQSKQAEKEREFRREDSERDRVLRDFTTTVDSISSFSNAAYERYVRAGMLKSAISRKATSAEVKERKRLYDESL